jgi:hypothetical protein
MQCGIFGMPIHIYPKLSRYLRRFSLSLRRIRTLRSVTKQKKRSKELFEAVPELKERCAEGAAQKQEEKIPPDLEKKTEYR